MPFPRGPSDIPVHLDDQQAALITAEPGGRGSGLCSRSAEGCRRCLAHRHLTQSFIRAYRGRRNTRVGMVVAVTVVVVSLVCALLLAVMVAVAAHRVFRRVRRRIDELLGRAGEVRTRLLPPGPRREAALLRRRLHAELRATRDMLEAAPDGLIFRADAASVLQELVTVALDIDRELRAVERFLDPAQQRAALKTVRPQAEQLIDTTYTARHTVLSTAAADRDRHLGTLHADVARQAAALDRYRQTTGELRL